MDTIAVLLRETDDVRAVTITESFVDVGVGVGLAFGFVVGFGVVVGFFVAGALVVDSEVKAIGVGAGVETS
jgi:hypothetical protein